MYERSWSGPFFWISEDPTDNHGQSRRDPVGWSRFAGPNPSEACRHLLPILEASGIAPASQAASDGRPVVLFIEQINNSVLDNIRESAQSGRRLMAVAFGCTLPMVERWAVLAAGASDLIEWDAAHSTIPQVLARIERW